MERNRNLCFRNNQKLKGEGVKSQLGGKPLTANIQYPKEERNFQIPVTNYQKQKAKREFHIPDTNY